MQAGPIPSPQASGHSRRLEGLLPCITAALFFLLTFRVLQYFPNAAPLREFWIIVVCLLLVLAYFPHVAMRGIKVTHLEAYIIGLFVIPLVAAHQAMREFGQPLLHGLLAGRGTALVGASLLLLYLLRRHVLTLESVERGLIWLAWLSLTGYVAATLFVDPAAFGDHDRTFVTGGFVEDISFKFDSAFVVFGFFYYAFSSQIRRDITHFAVALLFLLYLVIGDGGRSLLIALVVSYVFLSLRWAHARKWVIVVPTIVAAIVLPLASFYLVDSERFASFALGMSEAFSVVLTGGESSDPSVNARVYETLIAWPYISEHWFLGNGLLSHRWRDGYAGLIGYFYPADIGILGVIYTFGVAGVLVFGVQFVFALRFWRGLSENGWRATPFARAVAGFLLYYLIRSLANGAFALSPEVGLLFVTVLFWMRQSRRGV